MEPLLTLKKSINELPYEEALILVSAIRTSRLTRKMKSRKPRKTSKTMPLSKLMQGITPAKAKEMLAKLEKANAS